MRVNEVTRLVNLIPKERREEFLTQMRMQASVSQLMGRKFREDLFVQVREKLGGKR